MYGCILFLLFRVFAIMLCLRPDIHGFMRHQNSVFSSFTRFMAFVENPFGMTLMIFQSDGGRESDHSSFRIVMQIHRFSCPKTPQQNG